MFFHWLAKSILRLMVLLIGFPLLMSIGVVIAIIYIICISPIFIIKIFLSFLGGDHDPVGMVIGVTTKIISWCLSFAWNTSGAITEWFACIFPPRLVPGFIFLLLVLAALFAFLFFSNALGENIDIGSFFRKF